MQFHRLPESSFGNASTMSSILTALKKLEDENMARKSDPPRIDAEILRGRSSHRVTPFRSILLAMILFAGGGGATYLYLKSNSLPQQTPSKTMDIISHPNSSSSETLPTPRIQVESITPDPIISAAPDAHTKHISVAISKKVTNLQKVQPSPKISINQKLPTLKVNGIAFQDGADSVAVVNNIPVSKGSLIEGVRVDEIWRDRVQFKSGGKQFDIYLGKSNR